MSNQRLLGRMRPSRRFVRPSSGFPRSKSILHTDNLSLFDNLEFDIFDASDPYWITWEQLALQLGIERLQYINYPLSPASAKTLARILNALKAITRQLL